MHADRRIKCNHIELLVTLPTLMSLILDTRDGRPHLVMLTVDMWVDTALA